MMTHRGCRGIALISSLDGGAWSTPRLGRFTPGNDPLPLYRKLIGHHGRSEWVRKISSPTGIRSPTCPARSESLYTIMISRALGSGVGNYIITFSKRKLSNAAKERKDKAERKIGTFYFCSHCTFSLTYFLLFVCLFVCLFVNSGRYC